MDNLMKPELIIQDFAGIHNKDSKTSARLLKGASWKKQRVIVILPSADTIPAKVALSMWNLAFPPNNGVMRMLAMGMEVGDAYSSAIENVLAHPELSKWEYILTIEHDNMAPADGVVKLIERMEEHPEFDCIGGLYFTKGYDGVAQIWGDIKDPVQNYRPQPPDPNGGLVECYGTGMGFNLWRLSLFKDEKIKKPWFRTLNGKDGIGVGTQDLVFWSEARKYGHRCAIDCSVRVGHYDQLGTYGPADTVW
jgi:hypothetical protein